MLTSIYSALGLKTYTSRSRFRMFSYITLVSLPTRVSSRRSRSSGSSNTTVREWSNRFDVGVCSGFSADIDEVCCSGRGTFVTCDVIVLSGFCPPKPNHCAIVHGDQGVNGEEFEINVIEQGNDRK